MIEKILNQSIELKGYKVSFVMGQRVLAKSGFDWVEVKGDELTINEWEDLKDLCLQGNQKIQLETKGYAEGNFQKNNHSWRFTFIEKKDCYRAYLTFQRNSQNLNINIQNPYFWETLKRNPGLFIVLGGAGQGKTSFLKEYFRSAQNAKLSMIGIHCHDSNMTWNNEDSLIRLGANTKLPLEVYDGIERIIVDLNHIEDWKKWIEFSEAGISVHISLTISSLENFFYRLFSELDAPALRRFLFQLNGVLGQKLVGESSTYLSEFVLFKNDEMKKFLNTNTDINYGHFRNAVWFQNNETFQSMNQAIVQNLVRRQMDVATAFASSNDPIELDLTLKKMGL